LFLTALVCVVHLHRELHLGNINMLLLWVLILALEKMINGRITFGAILLGLAILAKPHFVVLLPLLLVFGKFRSLTVSLITLIAGVIVPALFLGLTKTIALHGEWLNAMAEHNAALIYTQGDDLRAVNTVYSFLHRGIFKYFMAPSNLEAYVLLLAIATFFGAGILWMKSRMKDQETLFTMGFLILVAMVPSITLTDTEHFLLALPLIAYLVHHLVPRPDPKWLIWICVPILFAYGGNWEDALGALSGRMNYYGVLGISNLGVILLCSYLFVRSNQLESSVSKL
ncbi:MAG: glycosyltransferase 87 family protein, partial [Flavobacteriales bacterium]